MICVKKELILILICEMKWGSDVIKLRIKLNTEVININIA